jgi:type IV pilus assembly protein PilB
MQVEVMVAPVEQTLKQAISTSNPEGNWKSLVRCSTFHARQVLSYDLAKRYLVLPLGISTISERQFLFLASAGALDTRQILELKFITGFEIEFEIVRTEDIKRAIDASYYGSSEHLSLKIQQATEDARPVSFEDKKLILSSNAAIPKLLETLLQRAVALGASDLHLEPIENGMRVRIRVGDRFQEEAGCDLNEEIGLKLVRRIQVLSSLDSTKTDSPQDGGFSFKVGGQKIRIRVSIVPQFYGMKAVLRILDCSGHFVGTDKLSLEMLGLTTEEARQVLFNLASDRGAILISGPTGSGKSTFLSSMIETLNSSTLNIVTMEDPVERLLRGVNQIQVNNFSSVGFQDLLRAALRQDPDVLMIGEIRDRETAETVLTASMTGMLVLSTVHAGSCIEVLVRLYQLGVPLDLIAATVRFIVSQRLVTLNCKNCRIEQIAPEYLQRFFALTPEDRICVSSGCSECDYGRLAKQTGVFEFISVGEIFRRDIRKMTKSFDPEQLAQSAFEYGYQPLALKVRNALISGLVSPEAALRGIGMNPDILLNV